MKMRKKAAVLGATIMMLGVTSVGAFAASGYGSPAEAVAGLTGKSVDTVIEEKQASGKTYGALANEAGVLDEFQSEMQEMKEAALQNRVENGTMTQERADAIMERAQERQADCDGTCDGNGEGNGNGSGDGICDGSGDGIGQQTRSGSENAGLGNGDGTGQGGNPAPGKMPAKGIATELARQNKPAQSKTNNTVYVPNPMKGPDRHYEIRPPACRKTLVFLQNKRLPRKGLEQGAEKPQDATCTVTYMSGLRFCWNTAISTLLTVSGRIVILTSGPILLMESAR